MIPLKNWKLIPVLECGHSLRKWIIYGLYISCVGYTLLSVFGSFCVYLKGQIKKKLYDRKKGFSQVGEISRTLFHLSLFSSSHFGRMGRKQGKWGFYFIANINHSVLNPKGLKGTNLCPNKHKTETLLGHLL